MKVDFLSYVHCRTTFDVKGLCCHYRATYFKFLPSKYQMYCLFLGSIAKIHADGFFKKSIIPRASCFWMLWNEEHGPLVCLEQWGPSSCIITWGSSHLEKCHLHLLSLYKASYYHNMILPKIPKIPLLLPLLCEFGDLSTR